MKKLLLIFLTINSPIFSMLRTQQVVTILLRNSAAIPRNMSTSQPPKNPCTTQEVKKDNNLTTAITIWSSPATGIILGTVKNRNTYKELITEREEPKDNNNDSDHD